MTPSHPPHAVILCADDYAMHPAVDEAVVQLNHAMEHTIRQCPTQYLWGYGRYKQPRNETPASSEGGAA